MYRLLLILFLLLLLTGSAKAQMPELRLDFYLPYVSSGVESLEKPCECTEPVCVCQE